MTEDAPPPPILVWCGRFGRDDGYGTAARSLVKAARRTGIPHVAVDLETLEIVTTDNEHAIRLTRAGGQVIIRSVDNRVPFVVVTHERPDRYDRVAVAGRARRVGCSYWESATVPLGWSSAMLSMDEIWASSRNNAEIFAAAGVAPRLQRILPIPVDVNPDLARRTAGRRWPESTVFFSVLSGVHRRDVRALYEAFAEAFGADDDVLLVLKTRRGTVAEIEAALDSVRHAAPRRTEWPAVEIIDTDLTREQLHRMQADADVYVSAERGNGWCLPAFDSMALGRPVVSLDWGGSADYLDPDDSYVVAVSDHMVFGHDSVPADNTSYDTSLWPGIDTTGFAAALRAAHGDPDDRRRRGERAAHRLHQTLSMDVVGARIGELIDHRGLDAYAANTTAEVRISRNKPIWRTRPIAHRRHRLLLRLAGIRHTPGLMRAPRPPQGSGAPAPASRPAGRGPRRVVRSVRALPESIRARIARGRGVVAARLARLGVPARTLVTLPALTTTMRDYDRCLTGEPSRFDATTAADRRRVAWGRLGVPRTPSSDLERLAALRGRHHGERIFVIGNGPSLNDLDLDRLAGESTFGVNKIYLKFPELTWQPTFYTLLDWRMGPAVASELAEVEGMTRFYPERFRGLLPTNDTTHWFWPRPVGDHIDDQFEPDATNGIPNRGTVLVTAIQLAFHLGFRDIILIGVDAEYRVPSSVIQSGPDAFGTGTRLYLESTADDDPNHFDPTYFGAGARWHDPNVDDMKRMFSLMRKGVERHGGRLRNATAGGSLECLERVAYDDLFTSG